MNLLKMVLVYESDCLLLGDLTDLNIKALKGIGQLVDDLSIVWEYAEPFKVLDDYHNLLLFAGASVATRSSVGGVE